jgi:hypothetical protein
MITVSINENNISAIQGCIEKIGNNLIHPPDKYLEQCSINYELKLFGELINLREEIRKSRKTESNI